MENFKTEGIAKRIELSPLVFAMRKSPITLERAYTLSLYLAFESYTSCMFTSTGKFEPLLKYL